MKKLTLLLLLVFLLAACGPKVNDPYEPLTGGVKGQTIIGPSCPVIQADNPCPDQPYQTTLIVLTLAGNEVTRFQTDEQGKFQVNLPPGDYILHPDNNGRLFPSAADVPFTVIGGQFTNIIITFDSGIR